jgi:dihydrofolate synthase / folylpolyglutamate synthase
LGNTLKLIATEKAGIIKPNTPVVIGETHPETWPVFEQKAQANQCPIVCADAVYTIPYSTQSANFEQVFQVYKDGALCYGNLSTPLLGIYQRKKCQNSANGHRPIGGHGLAPFIGKHLRWL